MELDRNKILIVDDEKALRVGLVKIMESIGFEPIDAADGEEALHLVRDHMPALIILDVMMGGMSGLDVCRMLKEDPQTKAIKIIMLSARGQIKEREEGLEAGADSYITKPFDYKELIKTIKELIGD